MKNLKNLLINLPLLMTIIILSATGCSKKDYTPLTSSEGEKRDRTMIIYMVSNNNLQESLWENIEEISEAVGNNDDCHVIAFVDTQKDREGISPRILELKKGKYLTVEELPDVNPLDPKDMNTVLRNIIAKFPADDYALVLSSHGSGWLPGTKSFGENDADKGATLEIKDISANLPVKFKFLIFDACLMADITTIYQMRNNADHIIASAAPVPGHGFDYDEHLDMLLQKQPDLKGFCKSTVEAYGDAAGCTMAVIDCSQLEKLAALNKKVFAENEFDPKAPKNPETRPQVIYTDLPYVDYIDMFDKLLITKNGLDELKTQFGKTVTAYYNNSNVGKEDEEHILTAYSGMSHFLFTKDVVYTEKWYSLFQQYDWWKDGGCENYIPQIRAAYNE